MSLRNLFKKRKTKNEQNYTQNNEQQDNLRSGSLKRPNLKESEAKKAEVNQSIFYMYAIIGLQVFFVFAMMAIFMVVGKILSTPWWIFLFVVLLGLAGCIYIYYKIKQKFRKLKAAIQSFDFSKTNVEVSIMGGVLTMRIEQNPNRLLEAPREKPAIEGPTIEGERL